MSRRLRVGATLATGLVAVAACGWLPAGRVLAAPGSAPRPVTAAWLEGVSATSGRNAWAVGAFGHAGGDAELIEHWNGRRWKVVLRGLNARDDADDFTGVAATSATSAFAAGTLGSQYAFTLIDQWDGARWRVDRTPTPGGDCGCAAILTGVAATSRGNAWAVGDYEGPPPGNALLTLILRKSGAWVQVPSPSPAGSGSGAVSSLRGVAALSLADAWAVGVANSGPSGQWNTVIEHWGGTGWMVVRSPDPSRAGCVNDELLGVAASPAATWAVGDYCGAALALRLEDGRWRQVPTPSPPRGVSERLASVAVTSTANAWAVGRIGSRVLILHWNGRKWATARVPDPAGATSALLASVTAVSRSIAWAVGQADYPHHVTKLLIERWDGMSWKLVPVPNPTP
jgi:hypothetical protein